LYISDNNLRVRGTHMLKPLNFITMVEITRDVVMEMKDERAIMKRIWALNRSSASDKIQSAASTPHTVERTRAAMER
jgi:hypothetical protein